MDATLVGLVGPKTRQQIRRMPLACLLGLRGTCDAQAAIFNPRKAHAYRLQLYIYTYPMTRQGEIGEMSCAEAIGGFASLSGSRGMLLAGTSDSGSQDRWILCADSIQRHVLLYVVKASKKKDSNE
ncbi:hypothetical protein CI102_14264 [Trichoderma harzianum]|nr:hypothetical protein CI102_14264 [Trichoderma harzianum]